MPRPPLPKEHGAWAMLVVPLLLGLTLAPAWHSRTLVLLVAALGFFLMRQPLATLVKTRRRATVDRTSLGRWAAIYGGLTALSGGWLILAQGLGWLAIMGLVGSMLLLLSASQNSKEPI